MTRIESILVVSMLVGLLPMGSVAQAQQPRDCAKTLIFSGTDASGKWHESKLMATRRSQEWLPSELNGHVDPMTGLYKLGAIEREEKKYQNFDYKPVAGKGRTKKQDCAGYVVEQLWGRGPSRAPLFVTGDNFMKKVIEVFGEKISSFFTWGDVKLKDIVVYGNAGHVAIVVDVQEKTIGKTITIETKDGEERVYRTVLPGTYWQNVGNDPLVTRYGKPAIWRVDPSKVSVRPLNEGDCDEMLIKINNRTPLGGEVPTSPISAPYDSEVPMTLKAKPGYEMDGNPTGCGISKVSGDNYKTGKVKIDCTVDVNFKIKQYSVSGYASPIVAGIIKPAKSIVKHGSTERFEVKANKGWLIKSSDNGCGGTLTKGNGKEGSYTTGQVINECSFIVNLEPDPSEQQQTITITGSGMLVAPGREKQEFKIHPIDASSFIDGGTITITISVGQGKSSASFDLFPSTGEIPTSGRPIGTLAGSYDIGPGSKTSLTYKFNKEQVFRFGATGNWFSTKGLTNTYSFTATITGKSKLSR